MPSCAARSSKPSTSGRTSVTWHRCPSRRRGSVRVRAGSEALDDDPLQSFEECPVPKPQQPVSELKQLQDDFIFSLAERPLPGFMARIAAVYAGFFAFVGIPVSKLTFSWQNEPVPFLAAASIGSCFIVTVTLLRLYLGWSFVGNRLLSATVEYEETGWYDGQTWVKTPQVLMRDRLLNNYTVMPAMQRIRRSLLASSAACVLSVAALQTNAHASERGPASSSIAPAVLSNTKSVTEDEYWDNVAKYEPWALEDGDAGRPSNSFMDHMQRLE